MSHNTELLETLAELFDLIAENEPDKSTEYLIQKTADVADTNYMVIVDALRLKAIRASKTG